MAASSLPENPPECAGTGLYEDHQYEQLPDSHESFLSDHFRINFMKILSCSKRYCHDWTTCPFCHHGEKARRRDPKVMPYTGIACPDMKKDGACVRGELCPYAHNVFEYWLHPTRYRTQLCNDGSSCKRRVCFFAHTSSQLRVPDSKPFVNPQALAAATAAAAARRSTRATEEETYGLAQEGFVGPRLQDGNGTAGYNGQLYDAMRQEALPAINGNSNAQIVQLLTALLHQKEEEHNSLYPLNTCQFSNEQLVAFCQSLGAGYNLPRALNEVLANGSSKAHGQSYNTPRSSLDLSGLRDCTSSDYTNSCRSSFETQQSQDIRRISQEGTRTESRFGALGHVTPSSDARMALDGRGSQCSSYETWANKQAHAQSQDLATAIRGAVTLSSELETVPLGQYLSSEGQLARGAAASARAALMPSSGIMNNDPPLRRASFDVAPGSYVNLSSDNGYLRNSTAKPVYHNGFVPSHHANNVPEITSPGSEVLNSAAFRSKSLPDGLSKNQFSALSPDDWNSFRGGHLPAVTEGVPFTYATGPGAEYGCAPYNEYMTPITTPSMSQDAIVAAPAAANPMWQSPFIQTAQLPHSTHDSNNGPHTANYAIVPSESFFTKPPVLLGTSPAQTASAPQLPETEEVLRGIASLSVS